jgi:hypothetical protein
MDAYMLTITLDFAGTPSEAENVAAESAVGLTGLTYKVEPNGPGGGNPCITGYSLDFGELNTFGQLVYDESAEDFAHLIN